MPSCSGTDNNATTPPPSTTASSQDSESSSVDAFINEIFQAASIDDDSISSHASTTSPTLSTSSTLGPTTITPCKNCNRQCTILLQDYGTRKLCDICLRLTRQELGPDTSLLFQEFSDDECNSGPIRNTKPISPHLGVCDLHHQPKILYCESCTAGSCRQCAANEHFGHSMVYLQDAAGKARNVCLALMKDARAGAQYVKESLELIQQMAEAIEAKVKRICEEVNLTVRQFVAAIEERQRELINTIEKAKSLKTGPMFTQMDSLRLALTNLARITDYLGEAYDSMSSLEMLQKNETAASDLRKIRQLQINAAPRETEFITFVPPEPTLFREVASLGYVQPSMVTLTVPSADQSAVVPKLATGRGRPILGAVTNVVVQPPIQSRPPIIFGGEGDQIGKLCRPWGICCDRTGNILIADRSNNRIQVFRPDGSFLFKFGTHGNLPGQLDRPAGICVDAFGRIVVVDKDNHRVQIFRSDGSFLLTFGEKGSKNGQFNYPWDVASNALSQLVVADTRNHRIQLFNSEGIFLSKFGFESANTMWKHFDSPRGVCFNPDGDVIVTDFNNHKILVISKGLTRAQFLGSEGTGDRQFLRPQGVICDDDGNYIVADSRNNRIQVFDPCGNLIWKLGSGPGRLATEIDRPSGVCLTLDGRIAVIDFGNHRVVMF